MEDELVCVKCGTEWVPGNFCGKCGGFCTFGTNGVPMMYDIQEDGTWVPKKKEDDSFFAGMEAVHDPLKNMSVDEYGKQIREGSYKMVTDNFDLNEVFEFCQTHRVEVLMQEDTLIHCYIDFHLETGKDSWATEFDGFTAMVMGIKKYKEYHKENS